MKVKKIVYKWTWLQHDILIYVLAKSHIRTYPEEKKWSDKDYDDSDSSTDCSSKISISENDL